LAAIQVALAYVDAQEEYFALNPDGAGTRHFALRALSTPGKRDGLYWAARLGEAESPLGAQFADARTGQTYHGYPPFMTTVSCLGLWDTCPSRVTE
jgi:hypothetical protein